MEGAKWVTIDNLLERILGPQVERQKAERRMGCLAEREKEREINALSNVFNNGNKTIKLDYNIIV